MNKLLCCKCGIEIRPNEGYYNAPSGPHCIHCWTGENINDRGKGIYVIKTGAGDYLKKARKFNSFINACNFRNLSPFLAKCEIVKLE